MANKNDLIDHDLNENAVGIFTFIRLLFKKLDAPINYGQRCAWEFKQSKAPDGSPDGGWEISLRIHPAKLMKDECPVHSLAHVAANR